MKANEAPEKIYFSATENGTHYYTEGIPFEREYIEYTRTDVFIEKVINFLNYKLDDVVAIRESGTIVPHHVAKQELIEDFVKFMKGE